MSLAIENAEHEHGFSPELGWSHYRVLMGVENHNERLFYEIEAEDEFEIESVLYMGDDEVSIIKF